LNINTLKSKIPERINRLEELAYNIWWSWHPKARDVFRALDYPLWKENGHNPVKLLIDTSSENLQSAAADPLFLSLYDSTVAAFDSDLGSRDLWFNQHFPGHFDGPIAYFSMEFALHNSLPIYAGGLGILAGDTCKEASDLGLPFIAVGFMYPQGYFHQHVSADGWQQEIYQQLDFNKAPIQQIFGPGGKEVLAQVKLEDRLISLAAWQVRVGRVTVYLLDTNVDQNGAEDRQLSARLYASDQDIRLQQEILLGIGGVRVLRALDIHPCVWHINEGHSAFLGLERAREEVERGETFESALSRIRGSTLFTTHTPIASGHDSFQHYLMDKYFAAYWPQLGIERSRFLALGQPDIRGFGGFNMTALAINSASRVNAVSQIHRSVSQKMWQPMWPETPPGQVPIEFATNGVHVPTWIGYELTLLFERYLGEDWLRRQDDSAFWDKVLDIPDEEIWAVHRRLKSRLIEVIQERAAARFREGEVSPPQMMGLGALLDGQSLTIGYARRCTDYKRPTLLLQDIKRLKALVNDPRCPVQIVFAGKSHPADFSGKHLLHAIYQAAQDPEFLGRIAFVEDYDMHLSRYLAHGIDVWLNTPYRLQEASGTSGMKGGINGVLNFSVRDGWWDEGYNGLNCWAIGPGPEAAYFSDQNADDVESIFQQLEQKIVPLYYRQDRRGIPREWVRMVKESIRSVLPRFSACRMLKEYTRNVYTSMLQARDIRS
jgi:glycogen phosphorylase